jgi:hypothetical protein
MTSPASPPPGALATLMGDWGDALSVGINAYIGAGGHRGERGPEYGGVLAGHGEKAGQR